MWQKNIREEPLSLKEAIGKAEQYCAYQERSEKEVMDKLADYLLTNHEKEQALEHLRQEGYVNNARFARFLAGGKFRNNKWGRRKIMQRLREHQIEPQECHAAIDEEIEEEEYRATLYNLLEKKLEQLKGEPTEKLFSKAANYATQKGYENELVFAFLKELIP